MPQVTASSTSTAGDRVVGNADFVGETSAGASDFAILDHWAKLPAEVDFAHAAALPMALETAALHLDGMHVKRGELLVVNGAGTTVGFAAVQIALLRGLRVIAKAGPTYADRLRALGAEVTTYGDAGPGPRAAILRELVPHVAAGSSRSRSRGRSRSRLARSARDRLAWQCAGKARAAPPLSGRACGMARSPRRSTFTPQLLGENAWR